MFVDEEGVNVTVWVIDHNGIEYVDPTNYYRGISDIKEKFGMQKYFPRIESLYSMITELINKNKNDMKNKELVNKFHAAVLQDMGYVLTNEKTDTDRINRLIVELPIEVINKCADTINKVFKYLWGTDTNITETIKEYEASHKKSDVYNISYSNGKCIICPKPNFTLYDFIVSTELPYIESINDLIMILHGVEKSDERQETESETEKTITSVRISYVAALHRFRVEEEYMSSNSTSKVKKYSSKYLNYNDLSNYAKYFTIEFDTDYQDLYEEKQVKSILSAIYKDKLTDSTFDYSIRESMYYFLSDKDQLLKFSSSAFTSLDDSCGSVAQRQNIIRFVDLFDNAHALNYCYKKKKTVDETLSAPRPNEVENPTHQYTRNEMKRAQGCKNAASKDLLKLDGSYPQNLFAITKFFNQRAILEPMHEWDSNSVAFAKYALLGADNIIEFIYKDMSEDELSEYNITTVKDFIKQNKDGVFHSMKETLAKTILRKTDEQFTKLILDSEVSDLLNKPFTTITLTPFALGDAFKTYTQLPNSEKEEVDNFVNIYIKQHTQSNVEVKLSKDGALVTIFYNSMFRD